MDSYRSSKRTYCAWNPPGTCSTTTGNPSISVGTESATDTALTQTSTASCPSGVSPCATPSTPTVASSLSRHESMADSMGCGSGPGGGMFGIAAPLRGLRVRVGRFSMGRRSSGQVKRLMSRK